MTSKVTINLSDKEQTKLHALLEDTGIRSGADLFVFLMNKEYKKLRTPLPGPASIPDIMAQFLPKFEK